MAGNKASSPDRHDRPSGGVSTVTITIVVATTITVMIGLGYRYNRRMVCEAQGQTIENVLSYDDRLGLREIMRPPEAPTGAPNWGDVRPWLEDYLRDWSELRTNACIARQVELERCLDQQKQALSDRIDAWLAGDRSWATTELGELIEPPANCVDA